MRACILYTVLLLHNTVHDIKSRSLWMPSKMINSSLFYLFKANQSQSLISRMIKLNKKTVAVTKKIHASIFHPKSNGIFIAV